MLDFSSLSGLAALAGLALAFVGGVAHNNEKCTYSPWHVIGSYITGFGVFGTCLYLMGHPKPASLAVIFMVLATMALAGIVFAAWHKPLHIAGAWIVFCIVAAATVDTAYHYFTHTSPTAMIAQAAIGLTILFAIVRAVASGGVWHRETKS